MVDCLCERETLTHCYSRDAFLFEKKGHSDAHPNCVFLSMYFMQPVSLGLSPKSSPWRNNGDAAINAKVVNV